MQPVIVTQVKMLLTGPSEPPPTAIIPHRMKPLVAAPEPLREATEVVPTVAPVAPAATPPEVSIHKTVAPHPASAGASPPCLPLGYCPALRGTASFPGAGHPREGQQASLLGDKYLLLEALEGSSLHRCLHIQTQEELVCKVTSPSYLIPPSQLVAFPFPSYLIYIEHRNSFLDPYIGSHLSIPCPIYNTFPPPLPNQLPHSLLVPGSSDQSGAVQQRATYCGVVALLCNCIHCHLRTRRKYPRPAAGQRRSHFRSLRPPPQLFPHLPPTDPRPKFPIFRLFFHPVFHNLAPQQPISGSAWQRLLRFGGELSPVGLPTIHKSSTRNFPTLF